MRVLVIEEQPTLIGGGQERSLFEIVSALHRKGIMFTLAYAKDGDLLPQYRELCQSIVRIKGRRVNFKIRDILNSFLSFGFSLFKLSSVVLRRGRSWNLIYVNQYFDLPLAAFLGMTLGIPVVCHLRLAAPHYLSRQYRWGLARCSIVIANSHFTASTYIASGINSDRIKVVHNAIDTEYFKPCSEVSSDTRVITTGKKNVLYLGRLVPEKGIEVLIDAFAQIQRRRDDINLLIVGNVRGNAQATESYASSLRRRAQSLLGASVEFRPATPDVINLYAECDLVVLPSIWDETFGRVVIEAMACGVPCIASSVGGIPEILDGVMARQLFEAGDISALAEKIEEYIDWRSKDSGLGARCRRHVIDRFDQPRMIGVLRDAMENVCEGKSRRLGKTI